MDYLIFLLHAQAQKIRRKCLVEITDPSTLMYTNAYINTFLIHPSNVFDEWV